MKSKQGRATAVPLPSAVFFPRQRLYCHDFIGSKIPYFVRERVSELFFKFFYSCGLRDKIGNIADRRGIAFHSLRHCFFPRVRGQRRQGSYIRVKEKSSVMHYPSPMHGLSVSADFFSVYRDVERLSHLRRYSERAQKFDYGSKKPRIVRPLSHVGEKGEIHVSEVVIYRSAAAVPPEYRCTVLFAFENGNLAVHVLILADNDGPLPAPQHEKVA